jgi:hypothetical protein
MTWESYLAWIWFAVETHLAVICASAPALKIFFKHTLQVSSFTSSFSFRHKSYSNNPISKNTNSVGSASDKIKKMPTRKLALNDMTVDTDDETLELPRMGPREKPFTIFSSEERLSGVYDRDITHALNRRRVTDEEAGGNQNHFTFFAETDDSD